MSRVAYSSVEAAELDYIKISRRMFDPYISVAQFEACSKEIVIPRKYLEECGYRRQDFMLLCREARK